MLQKRSSSLPGPVLFITTRSGSANGAALNAVRMGQAFRDAGVPAETWAIYSKDGARVPGFDRWFRMRAPRSPIETVVTIVQAWTAIVRARPRAVYGFHPLANVLGMSAAFFARTEHRIASQRNPPESQGRILGLLDKAAGTIGLYTANICVSPDVARRYAATYPKNYRDRMTTIWNGVPKRTSALSRDESRRHFDLPVDARIVGTTGRLSAQKNQRLLLDAFARVSDAVLVIAGDGELADDLHAQARELGIQDRVRFLGRVDGSAVPDVLRAFDVFAFPSFFEGFGLSLVEAMQQRLPSLVSDIPVFRDILGSDSEQPCGVVARLDDPDDWATQLEFLLSDHVAAREIGEAAALRAEHFAFETMRDGYLGILREPVRAKAGESTDA